MPIATLSRADARAFLCARYVSLTKRYPVKMTG